MTTSGEVPTTVRRGGSSASGTFVRSATGLVKEPGIRDIFIYKANNQNMGLGVLFILLFLGFYPGGNMEIGTIFTMLLTLPFVIVYAFFSGAMPRSGGDYVYNSRVLAPVVGFVSSFNWLFYLLVYVGQPAAYLTQYGLAPWFRIMGAMGGNHTLVTWSNSVAGQWGTIIGGTVMLVIFALVFRRWAGIPVVSIAGVLALIGLIIMEWILWIDPVVGMTANNSTAHLMDIVTPAVLAGGIVLYALSRFIQSRRGIDVEHAFAEIPPE